MKLSRPGHVTGAFMPFRCRSIYERAKEGNFTIQLSFDGKEMRRVASVL